MVRPRPLHAVGGGSRAFLAAPQRHPAPVPDEFLKDLRREMRRAERTQAALSLAVYRIDNHQDQDAVQADRLLESLHDAKRETDMLGLVGDNTIALLFPDTDEKGVGVFMRKLDARVGSIPLAPVIATYPDDLFDSLSNGARPLPTLEPFLACGTGADGNTGYALKPMLDLVLASLALCLLAPLMLVVALVIRLTSPGPAIFKQTRLGRGGEPFTFYKFRSMKTGADDRVHRTYVASLIGGGVGASAGGAANAPYKLRFDDRITRIGRFIRKTSIDELPQLFNVLKGEMSLVGPRPPLPYEASHYQSWHLRRLLAITPGITGLWQVEGRSKVTFNDMVRMDLRYQRECSLGLDLRILLRTVLVVLRCDGAV
jgi:lipopolysaccharide/colanic/teichoic acid biosynthesis glycosyltransferase